MAITPLGNTFTLLFVWCDFLFVLQLYILSMREVLIISHKKELGIHISESILFNKDSTSVLFAKLSAFKNNIKISFM